jgi:hypothetical protein
MVCGYDWKSYDELEKRDAPQEKHLYPEQDGGPENLVGVDI